MSIDHNQYDQMILDSIRWNARKSYSEIAEEIGVSRTTVKNRIEAMILSGRIEGFHTIIRKEKTDSGIEFFLNIKVKPDKMVPVLNYLEKYRSFKRICLVSGKGRIVVWGKAGNSVTIEKIMNYLERTAEDIEEMEWTTVLTEVKGDENIEGVLEGEILCQE